MVEEMLRGIVGGGETLIIVAPGERTGVELTAASRKGEAE
jgi:hypothetical protein